MESNDNLDKKLMKFCKYLIISAIVTYLAFKLLDNLPFFLGRLTSIFGTLINLIKPLIMGLITAYLLHFTVYGMEHFLESHRIFKKQGKMCIRDSLFAVLSCSATISSRTPLKS